MKGNGAKGAGEGGEGGVVAVEACRWEPDALDSCQSHPLPPGHCLTVKVEEAGEESEHLAWMKKERGRRFREGGSMYEVVYRQAEHVERASGLNK